MRLYITFYLCVQAVLLQTTGIAATGWVSNLSKIVNSGLFVILLFIFLLSFKRITANWFAASYVKVLIPFVFITMLCPLGMYFVLGRITELGETVRLYSWLLLIPLSAIAFDKPEHLAALKRAYYLVFIFVMAGFLYANYTKYGLSAYNNGLFYLGGIQNEATASLCLGMLGLVMAVPTESKGRYKLSKTSIIAMGICFLCLLAVLKRSTIVAFPVALFVMLYFLTQSSYIAFSKKKLMMISFLGAGLLVLIGIYVVLNHADVIENRTRDFTKYENSGDIQFLGAGRVYLANLYFDMFVNSNPINMVFGQFPLTSDTRVHLGYLNTNNNHPHNDFIDITLRGGIISLILLYTMLGSIFIKAYKACKSSDDSITIILSAVVLGVVFFYLTQAFVGTLFRLQVMSFFAVLLGAFLGIAFNSHTEKIKKLKEE